MELTDRGFFTPFMVMISLTIGVSSVFAQETWTYQFGEMMEVPSILSIESSPAHLYVLSEEDGLVVFRTGRNPVQWLYSSEGMERRGSVLQADVRFAYLYGDSRRLTIVEPTSVLGVYSSTTLPEKPHAVQRLGDHIYIAMGSYGLGRLSLQAPDDVDTEPEMLFEDILANRGVVDLVSDLNSRIYVLTDDQELFIMDRSDSDSNIELNRKVELNRAAEHLFLTSDELIGSNREGDIFLIDSDGGTQQIADVGHPVQKLRIVDDHMIVRTKNGQLWSGSAGSQLELWKKETAAQNHFTVTEGQIWISEYDQLFPVIRSGRTDTEATQARGNLKIKPVDNVTIPFPRPVILPLEIQSHHDPENVDFSYRSTIQNARIRGQSFFWQPTSNQTGRNEFVISASTSAGDTDTTRFTVDIRPFNTPPRFMPLPQVTVNVGEEFRLEITAVDPDGVNPDLIRYLGIDMPEGALLDEQTGEFQWTPTIRQAGDQQFQVIATDQFGAATSTEIRIRVIEANQDEEADIES